MTPVQTIGVNIRRLRKALRLSQQAVGQHLDCTFQQIQKYENGQNRLSADKLHALKELFKCSYADFFFGLDGAV